MKYEYCAPDPRHYAADLRLDARSGTLRWISGRGQDVLMLRTPYGQDGRDVIESLCAELSGMKPEPGKFTEFRDKRYAARYVTALERVRENGCVPDGKARSYTVFACVTEGLIRKIYAHREKSISTPCCHIPMRVSPGVEMMTESRGFFRKIKTPTGYYKLTFPGECDSNYADGDLEYRADGLTIPVTRRLMEAGEAYIYIKNKDHAAAPVFFARKDGMEII